MRVYTSLLTSKENSETHQSLAVCQEDSCTLIK